MSWFCNPIFQTEVSPTHRIALSIYPIPGYLPVWNAVCFIYSIPTSPLVYYTHLLMAFSLQHGLWLTWNVSASISVSTSWMISLWSEAFWSYSGRISGEIVNAAGLDQVSKFAGSQQVKCFEICHFSQPVGTFTRTFSSTSFCSWFA